MATYPRYLAYLGLTVLGLLGLVVTINYQVDPYLIHQWDSPLLQRLTIAQQKIVPWGKTYAAYRYQPDIVFIGSSRTEIGLPTALPQLADQRVLNLAISGASLKDAMRMLRHTSYSHRPKVVVWGLDFGWLFGLKGGNSDFDEALIATSDFYPVKRFLLNLKRAASWTQTVETWKILLGMNEQQCLPILASRGHKSNECLKIIMADEGGTAFAFDKIMTKGDPSDVPQDTAGTLAALDQLTQDYCRQGVAFRFFLSPVHALAELSYWQDVLPAHEQWKRDLAKIFDQRRQEGCDIRFRDFTGFNRITTEPVPQVTGKDEMRYYWEYSHYSAEAGKEILETLLPASPPPSDTGFGVDLTGATIEQHLNDFRRQRAEYCASHPWETRNLPACRRGAAEGPSSDGTNADPGSKGQG